MPPPLFDCHCQAVLVTPGGKSNPMGVLSQKDGLQPFKHPVMSVIGRQKQLKLKTLVFKHSRGETHFTFLYTVK